MARIHNVVGLAVSLLLTVPSTLGAQPGVTFSGYETRITSHPWYEVEPSISGSRLVFAHGGNDTDLYYLDLVTLLWHPVIAAPDFQRVARIAEQRIAYTDWRTEDVLLFNVATGITTNLTRADKESVGREFFTGYPAIDGDLVAWRDNRSGYGFPAIYAMDLATFEKRHIGSGHDADVSAAAVVWTDLWAIWSYDWNTRRTTQITGASTCGGWNGPRIDGRRIVYYGGCASDFSDYDIYLYDRETGTGQRLTLDGFQRTAAFSGDNVVFYDRPSPGADAQLKLWHIPTNDVFTVTSDPLSGQMADIDGNRIVYADYRSGSADIYMFTFTLTPDDTTPPAIALTPPCPATVTLNSSVTIDVMVTDEESGVAVQSVPNGSVSLDTTTIGPHSLIIEATDHAANSATADCGYTVIYDFAGAGGFGSPIADQPAVNSAKAGSAVPIKWQLPDGLGGYIGDLAAVTSLTLGEVDDFHGPPHAEIAATAPGASGLRYDAAAQQFVFVWKTGRSMSGRSYMLVLRLNDGMEYYANFTLK